MIFGVNIVKLKINNLNRNLKINSCYDRFL